MDSRLLTPQVIFDRQPALPIAGGERTTQVFQQWLRVFPGERESHDFGYGYGLAKRNPLRAGDAGPARSERIAGNHEVISDCTALDMALWPPRTIGKCFALLVTIFGRVAVYQHSSGALSLCGKRLESTVAIGIRVADQNDLAFHLNAVLAQQVVIFGISAMRVHHGSSDLAGNRHPCPRWTHRRVLSVVVHCIGFLAQ